MTASIFTSSVVQSLLERLDCLDANARPNWGVLSPAQMLKHLQLENDLALGQYQGHDYSNIFKEWAFKMVFKGNMGLPMIFRKLRMVQAIPELDVLKSGVVVADFETEKAKFIKQFAELCACSKTADLHPAIGKMSREEWGQFYAWHTDYHLTQFGV